MKKLHGIDFDTVKDFGPRVEGPYKAGTSQVVNGRDYYFNDSYILRFLVARYFDLKKVIPELKAHLEWRQVYYPLPMLSKEGLNLLNSGFLYVHGRTKDMSPMLIMDWKNLGALIKSK